LLFGGGRARVVMLLDLQAQLGDQRLGAIGRGGVDNL
jgi:hypothetical protein